MTGSGYALIRTIETVTNPDGRRVSKSEAQYHDKTGLIFSVREFGLVTTLGGKTEFSLKSNETYNPSGSGIKIAAYQLTYNDAGVASGYVNKWFDQKGRLCREIGYTAFLRGGVVYTQRSYIKTFHPNGQVAMSITRRTGVIRFGRDGRPISR